jgi:hypothetical protein
MATVNTIAMLNAIRNSASTEYQSRIPEATRDNLADIGKALTSYTPVLNEFTETLVGRIAMEMFSSVMAVNKLGKFKSGGIVYGNDVEEIFVQMAKAVPFDPEGTNPLTRKKPDVRTVFHRKNYEAQYDVSISDIQVRNAFTSESGLNRLLDEIVNSLYSGAEHDEFINMKELLATYEDYAIYEVNNVTDESTAKDFIKTVRKAAADLTYMSDQYNGLGVTTRTLKNKMALIVHKDVLAETDVEVLAKAFNIGKTDFEPTIIEVDNFGSMTNTLGLLIDEDFFRVFDTLRHIESMRNAKGLFTNYFLTIMQIQSVSKFKNAIRFKVPTA